MPRMRKLCFIIFVFDFWTTTPAMQLYGQIRTPGDSYASEPKYSCAFTCFEARARPASRVGRHVCRHAADEHSTGSYYMGRTSCSWRVDPDLGHLLCLCGPLVLVRTKKTRQEHLLAMHWMDGCGHPRCPGSYHLWVTDGYKIPLNWAGS